MRWQDSTVVVLASGPSLTVEDCETVCAWKGNTPERRAIAINTTFRIAPWADVIYGCDRPWWVEYLSEVNQTTQAELWTQDALAASQYGLRYIESQRGGGLSNQKRVIKQGGNGGHQAIGLAALWGARKIILLGFDMQYNGKSHWHGDHPPGLKKIPPFPTWLAEMDKMASDLREAHVECLNASRETALTCFAKSSLQEALS